MQTNICEILNNPKVYGVIYAITNSINKKVYIGKRLSRYLCSFDNYWGSGKIIKKAINKHGIQNFKKEILCVCYNDEDLNFKEKYYINKYNTVRPCGYNIAIGGNGGNVIKGFTLEERENVYKKVSDSLKKTFSENKEHYQILFTEIANTNRNNNESFGFRKGNIPYNKGMKMSEEHCNKLSLSHKNYMMSKETKQKISDSMIGRKPSDKNIALTKERCSKKVICLNNNIIYNSIKECYDINKNQLYCCFNTFLKKLKNKEIQNDFNLYELI